METEKVLEFEQPIGAIGEKLAWSCGLNPVKWKECYLYNAYEFLDQPGEWYLDTTKKLLFYI